MCGGDLIFTCIFHAVLSRYHVRVLDSILSVKMYGLYKLLRTPSFVARYVLIVVPR